MFFRLTILLSALLLFNCRTISAQTIVVPAKRSLADLQALPDDTMKALYLYRVAWDTAYYNLNLGIEYAQEAYAVSQRLNYPKGLILSLNALGATYNDMGEYDEALAAHMEGLKYCEKYGDYKRTGTCMMNLSLVYTSMGDSLNAQKYLEKTVEMWEENNYEKGLSVAYINLGAQYLSHHQLEDAKVCFEKSLALARKLEDPGTEAHSWSSLALTLCELQDYETANEYIKNGLRIADSLDDDYYNAQVIYNAAELYSFQERYEEAEVYYRKSLRLFREIGVREEEVDLYLNLAEIFKVTGRDDSALVYYKKHMALRDSLVNEDVMLHQRNLEAKYESEKQKQQIELLTRKSDTREWFLGAIIVVFLVLVFLVVMLYKRNQFRKQTNKETALQSRLIEEKNQNITDSINYASRIQDAVVPSIEQLTRNFKDAFVLSRPKDIVSGDYWWCSKQNGEFFLAGADSTGHGVPGGFMSMLGSVFLFEIITERKISSPAEILNQLRDKVISALNRSGGENSGLKDGMDMVMCSFSSDNKKLRFACAMNPLWVIRKNTVIEYRANKFPVGEYVGDVLPFTLLEHDCEPGDMIYIFSDGYADQFGGPNGKKLKYKQLRDTLCEVAGMSCKDQERILNERFLEWKGSHEQVDDVLVIGIRI
jgi:serine phosphatase RsbU (regulator of sigma subunit)/tetratricopeptide (TPR) repeat protein